MPDFPEIEYMYPDDPYEDVDWTPQYDTNYKVINWPDNYKP